MNGEFISFSGGFMGGVLVGWQVVWWVGGYGWVYGGI
jgi:hypothetical protein